MFCFDLLNDLAIVFVYDLDVERRLAVLRHLLNGRFTSVPTSPFCTVSPHIPASWYDASNEPVGMSDMPL